MNDGKIQVVKNIAKKKAENNKKGALMDREGEKAAGDETWKVERRR